MNQSLVAIVCGMPFSGTTYLSRLICAHPAIESGFECGMLFGKSPGDFKSTGRYYEWMMDHKPPYNWKLNQEQLDEVCADADFQAAYAKIVEHCELFNGEKQFILDKTPAYVYKLKEVMTKTPGVPVILVKKETMHQAYSFKKRKQSMDFFVSRYKAAELSKEETMADASLRKRILIIDFQDLIAYPGKSYRKIISFIARFNPSIEFNTDQIPELSKSLKADMQGNKKLRKTYSLEDEYERMKAALDENEMNIVTQLMQEF